MTVKVAQTIPHMEWNDISQAYFWISFDGQALTCRKCCRVIRWTKNADGYKASCCGSVEFMADYSREDAR